ncbi:DUF305 domain-containing protein [uncultured Pseudokineococcus sp.]|uniref:DUF305 domain-containing protein n=1 Tax=uncultured Pseudokineococcus sp. TaxID=1642928 RepID=UPI002610109D|nr:DUF305 domain-containing protein [uncultured Pseudokineococcus sp.]
MAPATEPSPGGSHDVLDVEGRPAQERAADARSRRRTRAVVVAGSVATGALLLVLGVVLGLHWGAATEPATPTAGSVEAGFSLDMQAHHRQAVEMSTLVLDRTDDEVVRAVARDIQLTQQQQAGQMYGWLEQWGLGQGRTEPVMGWMADHDTSGHDAADHDMSGHDMSGHDMAVPADGLGAVGEMPGMATSDQMDALAAADGVEAERIYLQLMITHHVAGVEMAEAAAAGADDAQVRHLATAMATGQQAELTTLGDMLVERGGPVAGV